MFLNTGNEYTRKGFKKLAKLKDDFSGASQIQVAMDMFNPFNAYTQGESSPQAYKSNLCGLFNKFATLGNPLTVCFQVMFIVCGLHEEYGQIVVGFQNDHRKFLEEDLASVTAWCKYYTKESYMDGFTKVEPKHTCCKAPASVNVVSADTGTPGTGNHRTPWKYLTIFPYKRIVSRV